MGKYRRKVNGKPTKGYAAWKAMKARCYSLCNKESGNYQKKDIQVCSRWKDSFENFIDDIGVSPSSKHSLDRIDNDKDYSPKNCRWALHDVQVKNRGSFNKIYTYKGETMVLKDWAKKLNINYTTLRKRIVSSGLSFEDAIKKDPFKKLIKYKGKKKCLKDWCNELDLPYQTIVNRKHEGWSIEKCFETPIKNNKK